MIYYLFESYFGSHGHTLRTMAAAVVSFLIVLLAGPRVIRALMRRKLGDKPEFYNASLNELTKSKANTPTMGGILIVAAILLSSLLFANLGNMYVTMGLFALVWLAGVGGVDDYLKLRAALAQSRGAKVSRDGFKSHEKLLFQVGLAVLLSVFIYKYGSQSAVPVGGGARVNPAHSFYLVFIAQPIALGAVAHALITTLTMVGTSNAVNLTDGMDGLAAGCMMILSVVLGLVSWVVGVEAWSAPASLPTVVGAEEMAILCAAMGGACLGFLWYNCHPAAVFMGDTGSLPLGGLAGYIAVVTRQEVLLVIAAFVFVMEALSVMLQVSYFKLTKRRDGEGKRIFRCAPLHHHFHLGGWAETKVVARFWILAAIFAAVAIATLKLR
jgi:phospho-N-acetylmuramoyl-pentapeptide-transferase